MQQTIPSWAAFLFGGASGERVAKEAGREKALETAASMDPDPGYVYLSASRAMPGFVQVDSSTEDPKELTWSLQTFSGVTRFRSVYAVRTSDCRALTERFRQAVPSDQIPHHADFYKIRLRLARNILKAEGEALPSSAPAPAPDRRKAYGLAGAIGLAIVTVICLALPALHERPKAPATNSQPTAQAAHPAQPVQPVPVAPPIAKPRFRYSSM